MNKRLTDSEWIIFKALWGKSPLTLKQIVQSIRSEQPDVDWSYKTFHTYLRNMCEKGLLQTSDRNLKDKYYSAVISREDAMLAESESLLSRSSYFGSVGRLVISMAEHGQLTECDQKELIKLAQKLQMHSKNEED